MIRRPPRSTPLYSSAASDVYKETVPEWTVEDDPEMAACSVERAVNEQGLSGMQFLISQIHLYGKNPDWTSDGYSLFWDRFVELGVPLFLSFSINEPKRDPWLDNYYVELQRLTKWMQRYPDSQVVMTHGFQWNLFGKDGKYTLPDELWVPYELSLIHI